MEIFMQNVNNSSTTHDVTVEIAKILHGDTFSSFSSFPLNFHVYLFKGKKNTGFRHSGSGALTLPSVEVGHYFLSEYGAPSAKSMYLGRRRVQFSASKRTPRDDVLETIKRCPYEDPQILKEREYRTAKLNDGAVSIRSIQFGWECRDFVFSIESEETCEGSCFLSFDEERREIQIKLTRSTEKYRIAIRFSQIRSLSAHRYLSDREPVIYFCLEIPPAYEVERASDPAQQDLFSLLIPDHAPLRQRLSSLPIPDHARVAPYTSLAIRLICSSLVELYKFRSLSKIVQLIYLEEYECHIARRHLFSSAVMDKLQQWLRSINWCVAFQVESLLRNLVVDASEMLSLMPAVNAMISTHGKAYAMMMLRHFGRKALTWGASDQSILDCFFEAKDEYEKQGRSISLKPSDGSLFEALHVTVTPTTMYLDGPFPERSNRVLRSYNPLNQESFLRVSFVDEARLQFRFDREVDGLAFIQSRIGPLLKNGLTIAKRTFHFLAYSQSALKEHAVWFVKEFREGPEKRKVNAETIIKSLGSFDNLAFDPLLVRCPARYAARLSQAFTATDASVSVEAEEIFIGKDISTPDGKYCFTDGVGTISKDLAREIWTKLKATKRRARRTQGYPRAFQVRFMGSKGMLSVDHNLPGRAIALRPSMVKFEAPESREIEIARAFDRPGAYFLNRPLIMLLEGLGIPYHVFKKYQDKAVNETQQATQSLAQAAKMLENYGLGTSYRLSSIMLSLSKLGIDQILGDPFYDTYLEYGVNHILRLLKNHARIPIPGAWTLVGVADAQKYLKEGEIFACIKPVNGAKFYLEGPVLISRSPTIHPGDVQIAHAIGAPPADSCFEKEDLPNTVVFSVLGKRPLPTCLGGGDLDGDVYNLIPLSKLPEFRPSRLEGPAEYAPAPKKLLNRPSTMTDVADFVMEYISSDVVGIIAINWLIIADQSQEGIFDRDCFTLAMLHSDAVDYPKSGQLVALNKIPKLKFRAKPDWNAPETINLDTANYYPSTRAIGRLFRDITLPAEHHPRRNTRRWEQEQARSEDSIQDLILGFGTLDVDTSDPLNDAIENRISHFIDLELTVDEDQMTYIGQIFGQYASELKGICTTNALSHAWTAVLTEEEAIVGTIVQKSSQPRKRKDMISKLREQTDLLVRGVREELEGDDDTPQEEILERAWLAWRVANQGSRRNMFGAKSFGWVALGAIFESIKKIEEDILEESRSRFY